MARAEVRKLIDRMAIPAINTALIPSDQKDAFNLGDPINDAAKFRPAGVKTIVGLRAAVDKLFGNDSVSLAGPLQLRVDYRVFKLGSSALNSPAHRVYAGLNLKF